jgi:hypothetical protein
VLVSLASKGQWAQTVEGPSGMELLDAVTDTAINSAARSGFVAFRLSVREWQDQTRKWRCGLSQAQLARYRAPKDWRCSAIPGVRAGSKAVTRRSKAPHDPRGPLGMTAAQRAAITVLRSAGEIRTPNFSHQMITL